MIYKKSWIFFWEGYNEISNFKWFSIIFNDNFEEGTKYFLKGVQLYKWHKKDRILSYKF